jgi:hypothetical protein
MVSAENLLMLKEVLLELILDGVLCRPGCFVAKITDVDLKHCVL